MSVGGTMKWAAAATLVATVSMPANAADLLPPSRVGRRVTCRPASRGDTSVHGDGFAGENALQTFLGRSVTFSTDPSGVIGGAKFGSDYQFSPNWLSGAEDELSQPRFR